MEILYGVCMFVAGLLLLFFAVPAYVTSYQELGFVIFNLNNLFYPELIVIGIIFLLPGIILFTLGLRKILKLILTRIKGIETYAIVIGSDIYNTRTSSSLSRYSETYLLVLKNNSTVSEYNLKTMFSEKTRTYKKVKYYKNNIYITSHVYEKDIPENIKNILESNYEIYMSNRKLGE